MGWALGRWILGCVGMDEIHSDVDHAGAIAELRRLWGAGRGTQAGVRVDRLMDLVEAYECAHHPIELPSPE